jgi:hypothetical protein
MELNIDQIQQDTELSVEFIYSVRIVNALSKINLNLDCDKNEAVKMIERTFEEYKERIFK